MDSPGFRVAFRNGVGEDFTLASGVKVGFSLDCFGNKRGARKKKIRISARIVPSPTTVRVPREIMVNMDCLLSRDCEVLTMR